MTLLSWSWTLLKIRAVQQLPPEKALGLDGNVGAFFKHCWEIIKGVVVTAIQEIFALRAGCWQVMNSANIVLLPKKEGAREVGDYRSISVMHNMAKLLGKILTNRLSPHLDSLISSSQSDFIKGRTIPDNFQYVQGAVKHFHRSKTPMLILKFDIAKAFDSVSWEYILEILEQMGFGQR
jgi:hypothetical protein